MKYLNIYFLLLIPFSFYCQCVIDAGDNKNICFNNPLAVRSLEGTPIEGDFVEFIWESEYYSDLTGTTYYASTLLSDTTSLTPNIEQFLDKTMTFYLTGITSDNISCQDSVIINFSSWAGLPVDKATSKTPEDTVKLWISAFSNWPHIQYEWSPNYMISDTTVENPLVWNDTTISYDLIITDSLGCQVNDDSFEVYIKPTSIINVNSEDNLEIFPIPASSEINISNNFEIKYCEVLSLNGKLLKRTEQKRINLDDFTSGLYILRVIKKDNTQKFKQFVIQK